MRAGIQTFEDFPAPHILESETVDLGSRSFAFTLIGDPDPAIVTLILGKESRTLTRDALREGLTRILGAIDRVPACPEAT